MSDDRERAERVAMSLGIPGQPVRHRDGWSNRVWLYADTVIRVATRPGSGTLHREASMTSRLPASVGYPEVIETGVIDGHEWMAQVRLPGENLAAVWDRLTSSERGLAVADLWARLARLRHADLSDIAVPPTPLYAFDQPLLTAQVAAARPIVGVRVSARVETLIERGLRATARVPKALVHTDAVLTNVIWSGTAAIPIDFEFAWVGPWDLDLDCVGREVVGRADALAIDQLRLAALPILEAAGAMDRLRAYSLLRDLWAISKWVERDPTCTDADSWGPVRDLLADVEHVGWLDLLCN